MLCDRFQDYKTGPAQKTVGDHKSKLYDEGLAAPLKLTAKLLAASRSRLLLMPLLLGSLLLAELPSLPSLRPFHQNKTKSL